MRRKKIPAFILSAFIFALSFIAGCFLPEPEKFDPINGDLPGRGVSAPARVVRDQNGLVHVVAANADDLFFALGYAMAQDRFQVMDLLRRAGAGRLSEFLGSPLKYHDVDLPHLDLALRAFRFEETAKRGVAELDPESRRELEAFSRGVNRYLKDAGDTLAIYQGYHVTPEPWTPADCFLVAEAMGLAQTATSFFEEYYLERLRRENGDAVRDLFVPVYPDDAVIITRDEPLLSLIPRVFLPGPLSGWGSNNWAIAGSRTVSGKPLISNDPHVPYSLVPTFWWHCQLQGAGYDAMGMMFPGLPCFGAATNGKLTWVLTNVMADYIDVWREKVNPANPDEYLVDGKWQPFIKEPGVVNVRGKKPVPYTMRLSRHGAVIDSKLLGWRVPSEPDEVLIMRYVDMDLARFYRGYRNMARANNFDEWLAADQDVALGPFAWNHVYADTAGNIAYWATGHFPIRKDNQGFIARRGWERDQDWQGYVPFAENPHLVNPKKGYLVTANNRISLPGYPYYITVDYVEPSRAARITELIEQTPKLDVADMQRIQYDVAVMSARQMVPIILADLEGAPDRDLVAAAGLLREWQAAGYLAAVDSRGTCVYTLFLENFPTDVFADEVNEKTMRGLSYVGLLTSALDKIIAQPDSPWFDDQKTPARETRREIAQRAIQEAMKYLKGQLGHDPAKWRWGDLSKITFSQTLYPIPGSPAKFKLGPYELPGTGETVRAAGQLLLGPLGYFAWEGPSSHFIVDFRDPTRAFYNCTTGMSDNPRSARYGNLTPDWLEARYRVMSLNEPDWRQNMMGELTLTP